MLVAPGLAQLVVGPPLALHDDGRAARHDDVAQLLDAHLGGLQDLVRRTYPLSELDAELTLADLGRVRALPAATPHALGCKRAMLLLGMFLEDEVTVRLASDDIAEAGVDALDDDAPASFAEDLDARILPILVPEVVRTLCQRPDTLARMATVLHVMWAGEDLGVLGLV